MDTKTLSCISVVNGQAGEKIQQLMKTVSEETNSSKALAFPPHLSIRNDFQVGVDKLDNLLADLKVYLSEIKPLELKVTKFGFYPWGIIYLAIEESKSLQSLHEEVMNIIQRHRNAWIPPFLLETKHFEGKQKEYIKKYGYQFAFEFYSPHITIAGNDMTEEAFEKTKARLSQETITMTLSVDNLTLIDRNKGNQVLETIQI